MVERVWRRGRALVLVVCMIVASGMMAPAMAQESGSSDSGNSWLTVSLLVGIALAAFAIIYRLMKSRNTKG